MIFSISSFLLVASAVVLIWTPLSDARESGSRIVGGINVEHGELPYQVSVQISEQHNCGGSILDNCWVLTAAHCVMGYPESSVSVLAGTTKLDNGGVMSAISEVILHENYTDGIVDDIALLRLKPCLPFNEDIQSVQLGMNDVGGAYDAIVSGWGFIDHNATIRTNDLKELQVTTITNEECNEGLVGIQEIAAGSICTLNEKGQGFCQGDSGGPLVGVESQTLIGLVAAAEGCAEGYPDVYTRISTYVPWIQNKMDTMDSFYNGMGLTTNFE